ncbi:MAG TPA: alkaline phosphatase family protein [Candidatus Dormibacteraeota bacterium]|nr:alkaline phosphatase family protein [Candidatus Dormibacteraeota bacterium]
MRKRIPVWLAIAAIAVLLSAIILVNRTALFSAGATTTPLDQPAARGHLFDHIFVVMLENRSFADIIESGQAPYLSGLAQANGLATQYVPVTRGSLPNYLALTGGDTFDHSRTCLPAACGIDAPNLADRLEAAGMTWRAYMESMPQPCDTSFAGTYSVSHDPFVYFDDIRTDPRRCSNHVVPLQQMAADLRSPASLANFVWITPNLCHDMHDCGVGVGDRWLAQFLPTILKSAAFTEQNSLLVVTWDEGNFTHANQVATILVAPRHIRPGTRLVARYDDYSLLRTMEVAWGLAPLTSNDTRAKAMTELFSTY